MTRDEAIAKMIQILKEHDIKMDVGGCGCCDSPWVSFSYRGETILDEEGECSFGTEDG